MPAIKQPTWAPGPLRPVLDEGAVHVWRADLAASSDEVCELLCEDERARAERMLRERDRRLWSRSRGVLRALLGRYLQRDPRSLSFVVGAHGKPALAGDGDRWQAARERPPGRASGLSFNLSHSGRVALYAFSEEGAVGVDVEVARRPLSEAAIAARVLGAPQAQRLRGLDPESRRRELMRAWVRHEAELKCLGVGLAGFHDSGEARRPTVVALEMVDMESGAVAALATERPMHELRRWDWR